MCAIGCLIPDDLYDPKMEGKPVANDWIAGIMNELGVSMRLAKSMQMAHDTMYATSSAFRDCLRKIAISNNLMPGAEQAIERWSS